MDVDRYGPGSAATLLPHHDVYRSVDAAEEHLAIVADVLERYVLPRTSHASLVGRFPRIAGRGPPQLGSAPGAPTRIPPIIDGADAARIT